MGKIHVLSERVANQIAAGEVVEETAALLDGRIAQGRVVRERLALGDMPR